MIKSPFPYPGGKYFARKHILPLIPKHTSYYEPFVGGGSIFFGKEKSSFTLLNDLDSTLMDAYTIVRDNVHSLLDELNKYELNKETYLYIRDELQPTSQLQRAARWMYLNKTSYGGIVKSCNWRKGKIKPDLYVRWFPVIQKANIKLQGVNLTSIDFEEIIDNAFDGSFMYVDPPYDNIGQKRAYIHYFEWPDHLRLAECLERNSDRLQWLLTYNNSARIKSLYKWANRDYREWHYTLSNNSGDDREMFISNYEVKLEDKDK